jgi:hypothetical protein
MKGRRFFLEPCNVALSHVADCIEKDVDALSDKTIDTEKRKDVWRFDLVEAEHHENWQVFR